MAEPPPTHPYVDEQQHHIWPVIEKVIHDLERNQDVQVCTAIEYVVGPIVKAIIDESNW